jgi:ankyrin repeat protein
MDSKDKDDWTSLSWAIENGHKEIVQLLLAEGVDTDSKDKDGRTPRMGTRRLVNVIHGLQLVVVSEKLNVVTDRGRRKLSVVTDGATRKRSAVPHFQPYRTRTGSHI